MESDPLAISHALLQSLISNPSLVGDLPESRPFLPSALKVPSSAPQLNLKQKLGHLYEDALAFLLQESAAFELLEQNLQLRTDIHNTVGELDFLLRNRSTHDLIHLELATKFYLAVESENGTTFPGPDARDNYHRKLNRLREHQLILTRKFPDLLPEKYRGETVIVRHLIQGCFFDHISSSQPSVTEFINPTCRRGRWLRIQEVSRYFPLGSQFQIIPKPLWPVPFELLVTMPLEKWQPTEEIDRCLMVRVNDDPLPHFIASSGYPYATPVSRA